MEISYAEVICQYYHNVNGLALIDPRKDGAKFAKKLIENHKVLMENNLVCDHLTENRTNNYSWALTIIPQALNKKFGARAAIAKPYFFFTVWDEKSSIYKVKFGIMGNEHQWERRYSFISLDEETEDGRFLYKKIFDSFKKRIGPKYAHTDGETYLRYWSDPEHVYDEGNPLVSMLEEPINSYPYALMSFNSNDITEIPII